MTRPAELSVQDAAFPEEDFLREVGSTLVKSGERYWTADLTEEISYPSSAHKQFAEIEESSFWFRHRNAVIGSVIEEFPPLGPVVDVGGGNGYVSLGLRENGFASIVLEPGSEGAMIAHSRGLHVIRAAFTSSTFAVHRVPAIGLFDVLEHVADELGFLRDCATALIPGGKLYLTVPAFGFLWSDDDVFAGHYRRYTRRSLSHVLRQAGFEVQRTAYFFAPFIAPLFLLRTVPTLLGRRRIQDIDQAVAQHRVRGITSKLLDTILRGELAFIRSGISLPFGTSLVAVATTRK